jgi:hypothetical protein
MTNKFTQTGEAARAAREAEEAALILQETVTPPCYPFVETLFTLCDSSKYPVMHWSADGMAFIIGI